VLSTLNRLFAPFLPFVTEEVWSWWRPGSVHTAPWPNAEDIAAMVPVDGGVASTQYLRVSEVLGEIRKRKAEAHLSPGAPLSAVRIRNNESLPDQWPADVLADLKAAARTSELNFIPDAVFDVEISPQQERTE
jgi:valyl-tRNA synthetase